MVIATSVVFAFLVLIGQLWYLQVLEGGRFLDASDKNRIRVRPIAAPRGILFDRHGMPLVDNRPAFTLSFIPRELPRDEESRDAVLGRVASLLHIPYPDLTDAVARVPSDSLLPVRVRRGLTLADVAKIEEWKLELPGVITEVEPQRVYPTSRFAAHLLGYVREANDEQLKQGRYRRGDMVGQSGLERLLDEYLRGQDGGERIEVDAMGRPVRRVQATEPHSGAQVITTVDRGIQEAAERAMEGLAGAVVVMDPRNGDVLAMVSTPAFELDRFTGTIDRDAWLRVVQDPNFPLLNRTIQTQYAPGSVFKILVSAAGLQEGSITPLDRTYCNGEFHLGTSTFKDWKEGGHGTVDLHHAIAQSCNIFFYEAGLKIGGGAIVRYASMFGFGQPTAIDLPGEKAGLLPKPQVVRGRAGTSIPARRDGQHVDRTGHRARDADADRALHGGGRQRRRPLAAASRAAGRAPGSRRLERSGPGLRPRRALAGGVGVPPPEPLGGRERQRDGRGGADSRARHRGQDRDGADDRQVQGREGSGPRVVRLVRAREGAGGGRHRARGARR